MTVVWRPIREWDDEGWREQAACRHVDADLFFPAGTSGSALEVLEAAQAVCRSCPVQVPCLHFALETAQESGVWGGVDEQERRQMRKLRRAEGS